MTGYSGLQIWLIIVALGLGTFLIRFSFLGLVGDRELPPFVLRLLRYTAVAVIPGLVAPLVAWPAATGGQPDAARLLAAAVALGLGVAFRNVLLAIFGGAATLFTVQALLG
ncbi:Branched-chain amino acid transport protein [Gemmobacter megaterium]|uniref:Branched-chain amino acid transport protein n=1 Tax=Gemmobacter megaterium TaxID=1086013 RepID=A0A1N7M705_9RHOB|nr:AzlD domain-containing protein [Gemmobacter megaterium]GGE08457.1 membrane protein [Gemmobacter megaterium]SIS81906.1 Branched-chain amino acid transport protein [Gemmobacter megaterium]